MSAPFPGRPRAGQKTYSHLAGARRVPSDYEVVSSELLYYPGQGRFETDLPVAAWYARHQSGSPFRAEAWERFHDPRETTYASYVALQRDREAHVDRLLASREDPARARPLAAEWNALVASALFPLRYPIHALSMVASYVGHLAPSGRIVVVASLQAADEVRRLQRLAYVMALARRERPDVEAEARKAWEERPEWQPLRETIEHLLVAWDWGEAFVALNLAVKPWLDALINEAFAERARAAGDVLLAEVLRSFAEDSAWHRAWSHALLAVANAEGSAAAVAAWRRDWSARAEGAVRALAPLFDVPERELETVAASFAVGGEKP